MEKARLRACPKQMQRHIFTFHFIYQLQGAMSVAQNFLAGYCFYSVPSTVAGREVATGKSGSSFYL